MTRNITILCTLLTLLTAQLPARADDLRAKYTKERPVVIITDWDFAPYEYLGESGEAEGYNIDLVRLIFEGLNIPYTIVQNNWHTNIATFNSREGDLIISIPSVHSDSLICVSRMPLHYYHLAVATRRREAPLKPLQQLTAADGTLAVKEGDYAAHYLKEHPCRAKIELHSPKEALRSVVSNRLRGFIWGEEPLKWKIRSLHLESLQTGTVNIPVMKFFIIGYDQELINAFDDQYARLLQEGEVQALNDKWFHPEHTDNTMSYVVVVVILLACLAGLVVFLLSRLIKRRVKKAQERASEANSMMKQALSMGDYLVFVHDLREGTVTNEHGHLLPEGGVSMEQYVNMLHPDDRASYHETLRQVQDGKLSKPAFSQRLNIGTNEQPNWQHLSGSATVEVDELGSPRYIVNTVKNITHDLEEERRDKELGARFFQLFDTNLIAMSFYSPEGRLVNFNQKMKKLSGIDDSNVHYFQQTNLFEATMFKGDLKPGTTDDFQACQHMYYPELGIDTYIELKVMPYFDDAGNVLYYVVSARDVNSEREQYMHLACHERELRKTNEIINGFEHKLSFLLSNCDMYTFRSNVVTRTIEFSQSLREVQYQMTSEEYLRSLFEEDRKSAIESISSGRLEKPFSTVHHFHYSPLTKAPAWYAISAMPLHDKDGTPIGHFGLVRDVTQLMEANEQLRRESLRAENSGKQKSAFLANMTHEIRTPLNAIVGFSDLLPVIDTDEEKQEFIRIIRNNCDMLLRLINDILEASDMTSKPLDIEPTDVDFAQVFDDICQTLAQRVDMPDVEFIKYNPYTSFPTRLDKGRIQQVVTNFVTNAVKYTTQGHIKVGYFATPLLHPLPFTLYPSPVTLHPSLPTEEGLYIYCEDTGTGIPKDKQASVFERFVKLNDFVQGTGLGLAICKSIAERCGGQIGVDSEGEGHGSTFWFWIPCPLPPDPTLAPNPAVIPLES